MLPAVFGLLSPLLPVPLTIILTAVVTYCLSFVISRLIGKLPFGKYIVGWKGYSRSWLTKYASRIARSLVALQDDGMEVFDLWVQRISSSETLYFEDEISILPVSSSKKGLNEDETGSGRLFPDALSKTNWMSISYNSLVHIRFIFFQTFPNSGNAIKNAKKVLWNISERDFWRYF